MERKKGREERETDIERASEREPIVRMLEFFFFFF
jgi:hypothetical protein